MRSLALAVSIAPAVALASPCPPFALEPRPMTPAGAVLPPDGGFLVAAIATMHRDANPPTDPDIAAQSKWRITSNGRTVAPAIRVLAPGLDLYELGGLTGEVRLENDARDSVATALAVDKATDLDAPVVRAAEFETSVGAKHPWTAVTATLAKPAPAHAIAVIVYGKDGARSWAGVQTGAKIVGMYSTGSCAPSPNGTLSTGIDDEIQLAWVADSGRVSKKSAKVKVRKK